MPWSLSSPCVGEVGAYCSGPPLAHESSQPPALVERALRAARQRRVSEEDEGVLEEGVR